MRPFIPFLLAVGALQLALPEGMAPESTTSLLATAATLAGLTVMVYRLGVWRQEMFNTKHNVGAEVSRLREESTTAFAGINRRLDTIDRQLDAAAEQRVASERWRARVDTTLAGHDRDFVAIGQRMDRIEGAPRVEVG